MESDLYWKSGLTTLSLLASALFAGGSAMADVIRVIINDPDARPIVTNGDVSIGLFRPTLVTQPWPPIGGGAIDNAIRIAFESVAGDISGVIEGNHLPFPVFPLQSPSLFADGGLMLRDTELDASGQWFSPQYDSVSDTVIPASMQQFNEFGYFQLQNFPDEAMAYIGYADAALTRFGYVQIQRQSLTQWTLIGQAYAGIGESILVEDLTEYIPVPPSLLILGAGTVGTMRRQRLSR